MRELHIRDAVILKKSNALSLVIREQEGIELSTAELLLGKTLVLKCAQHSFVFEEITLAKFAYLRRYRKVVVVTLNAQKEFVQLHEVSLRRQ
jgi:hypothetical protein